MGLHVVLYEPEIPANTVHIERTCLATDTALHLIHTLGFSTENKMVQRAGLEYWKHVNVRNMIQLKTYIEHIIKPFFIILKTSEKSIIRMLILINQKMNCFLFLVKKRVESL